MSTCWSDALPLPFCAICCMSRVATPSTYLCAMCHDPGLKVTPLATRPGPGSTWSGAFMGGGSA